MASEGNSFAVVYGGVVEDEASNIFVRRQHGDWSSHDEAALAARLARDADFANAYYQVKESWAALDRHAEAPEIMQFREQAIAELRRANARRWLPSSQAIRWRLVAAVAGLAIIAGVSWQISPYGYHRDQYQTALGEQRLIELDDHSRIAMDAATRLNVRYSGDARIVRLSEGQAQFSVAKDPTRPFKVQAGERIIVAVGTVFTVEYADQEVNVATIEGKVAVLTGAPRSSGGATQHAASATVELVAGEAIRIRRDGSAVVTPNADLKAATAWREGKIILRGEPLGEAVRRMNRYSRIKLQVVDDSLAAHRISGVFEAGDGRGFVDALERYLPIEADYSEAGVVRLGVREVSSAEND